MLIINISFTVIYMYITLTIHLSSHLSSFHFGYIFKTSSMFRISIQGGKNELSPPRPLGQVEFHCTIHLKSFASGRPCVVTEEATCKTKP
jgi:hypothetical protein